MFNIVIENIEGMVRSIIEGSKMLLMVNIIVRRKNMFHQNQIHYLSEAFKLWTLRCAK